MVPDWCLKDSGTGMSGMCAWSLPDLIAGGEGRRSDCIAGSVPSNWSCVEHVCCNGNTSGTKLNPTALGCCKVSFIFQSVVLRATILPVNSCVFCSTSLRLPSCHVSARLPEKNLSAASDKPPKGDSHQKE